MSYWKERQGQLFSSLEKDEAKLKSKLSAYYDTESKKLEKEIAAFYQTYGENNVIEYRRLMERLSDADKQLLIRRMDEFSAKYPQYQHLMPVRESIYELNRLEGLQTSIKLQQFEIGAIEKSALENHLLKQAERAANTMAEELGFGKNFYRTNNDIISTLINQQWADGKNFSERIWANREKLAGYLTTDFAQGIARGDSYQRLVKQLQERFGNVSRRDIYRLIYTEGTFVVNEGMIKPFEEDFEKYRFSTVGDNRVCDICQSISDTVFDIKDREAGVNFPPMHAWCRCSFTIEIDDNFAERYEQNHSENLPEIIDNSAESDIINTGAISGALNPYSKAAEKHANTYYESVRHMTTDTTRISKATGISQDKIDKIKNHIFIDEHDLIDGRKRFDPSYDMAQSWQRLISGSFEEKDIVLLKHEYAELRYMEKGLSQNEAHIKASKKYNYAKYCE